MISIEYRQRYPASAFNFQLSIFSYFYRMRSVLLFILCLSLAFQSSAQIKSPVSRPKLVVGIVVDQMRADYISRYWNRYGNGGFKRLYNEGYNYRNTLYPYMPTYTGPGHASIYTGTTPALHGIVANDWMQRDINRKVYCTQDDSVTGTGSGSVEGKMSPHRLRTTTITDELKLSSKSSKVIGIAIKDRGAILPAGHLADAAFWYDGSGGNWISSSWYLDSLPQWAIDFNNRRWPDEYLTRSWNTLFPIETYTESEADSTPYESPFAGETGPVFPHNLSAVTGSYDRIRTTPFGNTLTKDFAVAAIKGEQLGKDSITDFLCISFSSPDYVGHRFTIRSIETEDTYLRLDRDIADLLNFLDKNVGKNQYLVFLTADHGAMENPQAAIDQNLPGGMWNPDTLADFIRNYLQQQYGKTTYFKAILNDQVHLDHAAIISDNRDRCEVMAKISEYLRLNVGQLQDIVTACQLEQKEYSELFRNKMQKGYLYGRSGDITLLYAPGYTDHLYGDDGKKGTTHGSPYSYDSHVPLIWFGWRIQPGFTVSEASITDIAPTLSQLLQISLPSGVTGQPLQEVIR